MSPNLGQYVLCMDCLREWSPLVYKLYHLINKLWAQSFDMFLYFIIPTVFTIH